MGVRNGLLSVENGAADFGGHFFYEIFRGAHQLGISSHMMWAVSRNWFKFVVDVKIKLFPECHFCTWRAREAASGPETDSIVSAMKI